MVRIEEIMEENYKIINSSFFNNGPMIAFVWRNDAEWSVKALSNNIEKILGYTPDSFKNGTIKYAEIIHPEDLPRVFEEVTVHSKSLATSFTHKPYRVKNIDGKYIWVDDNTSIVYDSDQNITNYIGYITDCTDKIENIVQLKNLKERWGLAWEGVNDGVWDWDLVENKVYFSPQWKKMLGFETEDLNDQPETFFNLIHNDDKNLVESMLQKHFENPNENLYSAEIRLLSKDGNYKWILIRGKASLDQNNRPIRMVGSHTDISQRKLNELTLKEQKSELQTIFDITKAGLAVLDMETNFKKVNKAYCEITGLSEEELLSTSCLALTRSEDIINTQYKLEQLVKDGYVESYEKTCVINERKIIVNVSITMLPDKEHFLLSMKDISKFKAFEEQSKLASMGEMIGNIAHQWRQPLSVISATSSGVLVKNELGILKKEMLEDAMENITSQVKYLSKTIDDFRNFIKNRDVYETINIGNMLEKTYNIVKPALLDNHINLILDINVTMMIQGNENELIQAFINFINNARDALIENIPNEKDRLIFLSAKEIENGFEIVLQDSGGGIPNNVMGKIFEPYFTTKDQSIGTGIGLAMTHKIITEKHKGIIEVSNVSFEYDNHSYYGACFLIRFIF